MFLLNVVFLGLAYYTSSASALLDTAENPFVYLNNHNYTYENHTIVTEDGYVLLTVRIPCGNNSSCKSLGPPVIFFHCFLCTFYDFLNAGPDRSLGFEVLRQGFDVWLVNTRGSTLSKKHVALDPVEQASKFWNFSFHEAGLYDIPANIDYITSVRNQSNVSVVCFSQGCTELLVLLATRPAYNSKIKFAILLAPVTYMRHVTSPWINFAKQTFVLNLFSHIIDILDLQEMASYSKVVSYLAQTMCKADSPVVFICRRIFELIGGNSNQANYSLYSVAGTNDPAGSSFKVAIHFLQTANSGEFQLFDYGTKLNQNHYHQSTPPSYNLSQITVPFYIFLGSNDYFLSTKDAEILMANLRSVVSYRIIPEANHMDMLWGSHAPNLVYKPAISQLNHYNNLGKP